VLASIPAPPFNAIGPFRLYGLLIALGVLAAVWLGQRRFAARGGDPEEISNLALITVPAGLVGARLYHVITDYQRLYCGPPKCEKSLWPDALQLWNGGLGIPGAIIGGFLAGYLYARAKKWDIPTLMDVAAPCLPLAQAIGRWGNYFNQELFGRPTDLPWGLQVDPPFRPLDASGAPKFGNAETFHPTFLYESLWNIGVVVVLLAVDRRRRLRDGKLFPLYVGLYFLGRMWVEELRVDEAAQVGSLRWNFVLSIVMVVLATIWFLWGGVLRPDGGLRPEPIGPRDAPGSEAGENSVAEEGPDLEGPGAEVASAEADTRDP
jgi:prolipoprotein diacylglyceryl transferase